MVEWFLGISNIAQALIATIFTWAMTALGASTVFFFKTINKSILNLMLGFAAGVMVAAAFWSLLAPAVNLARSSGSIPWLVVTIGFALGGGFLFFADQITPHIHLGEKKAEGLPSSFKRSSLLVLAVSMHNIPEGLTVGVAFGAVAAGIPGASIPAAIALAIGMGLQNFPEGAAVSIPLRREGFSRWKSFLYGQASGLVEPIGGLIGAWLVFQVQSILPYALAFSAGAMIYVVIEELLPEAQKTDVSRKTDISTIGFLVGFILMMALDVGLA